ncbi:hypothetical protein D3C84_1032360 [compost metagenome]
MAYSDLQFGLQEAHQRLHPCAAQFARGHQQVDGGAVELPIGEHPYQATVGDGFADVPLRTQHQPQALFGPASGHAAIVAQQSRLDPQGLAPVRIAQVPQGDIFIVFTNTDAAVLGELLRR